MPRLKYPHPSISSSSSWLPRRKGLRLRRRPYVLWLCLDSQRIHQPQIKSRYLLHPLLFCLVPVLQVQMPMIFLLYLSIIFWTDCYPDSIGDSVVDGNSMFHGISPIYWSWANIASEWRAYFPYSIYHSSLEGQFLRSVSGMVSVSGIALRVVLSYESKVIILKSLTVHRVRLRVDQ